MVISRTIKEVNCKNIINIHEIDDSFIEIIDKDGFVDIAEVNLGQTIKSLKYDT